MSKIAMTGEWYGRLLVLREHGKFVDCRCECGQEKTLRRGNVLAGYSKSCGCFRNERILETCFRHGQRPETSKVYRAWKSMWQRCTNPNKYAYHRYGGRGITVCEAWKNFVVFWSDMGEPPSPELELDRIDNSLGYSKENCRWVTHEVNANNRG